MTVFKPIVNSFKDFWVDTYVSAKGIIQNNRLLALVCLIGCIALIALSRPYPTEKVYLSIGQKGSSYDLLGDYLQAYFKKYGLELVKVETQGLDDGLEKLDDDESQINAAFLVAGRAKPKQWSGLVSLGSIQYAPAWLFYRGARLGERDLLQKKIAIGAEGTNTLSVFKAMANTGGFNIDNQDNLLKIKHSEAVSLLNAGMIDGLFIVDGFDSDHVQALLTDPKNKIYSYALASAFEKQLPFLKKLTIPRGALDLKDIRPWSDTDILSTTITLLVEDNLNPYTQWVFLKAVRDLNNNRTHFFAAPGFFPAYLDRSIPLSSIAQRYYDSGFPPLSEYLPFWLAIYLDRVWVYILAFLAVALPLAGLIPGIRNFYIDSLKNGANNQLVAIQMAINPSDGPHSLKDSQNKLDTLEAELRASPLKMLDLTSFIELMENISFIRSEVSKMLAPQPKHLHESLEPGQSES